MNDLRAIILGIVANIIFAILAKFVKLLYDNRFQLKKSYEEFVQTTRSKPFRYQIPTAIGLLCVGLIGGYVSIYNSALNGVNTYLFGFTCAIFSITVLVTILDKRAFGPLVHMGQKINRDLKANHWWNDAMSTVAFFSVGSFFLLVLIVIYRIIVN